MKKLKVSIVVLLTLAVVGTAFAAVDALPGSGWWTSVGIQNPATTAASVQLTAYHVNGGATDTHNASFSIPAGGSVTFLPGAGSSGSVVDVTPPLESGFQGSMVASSDQPLVAIGQVGNNVVGALGVAGGYASAQYRGSNLGATSLAYPTVKNNFNGKTTTFYIQAAGADTTVNATVKTADGATHTASMAVSANKTWVLSPGDFTPAIASTNCGAAATSPCLGAFSAATSGGEIVGAVVEHQAATSPATIAQSTALFLPSDADTTVFCPTFKNAYGGGVTAPRTTGITVQNTSGSSATVYLTLKTPSGTAYTSNAVVPSLGSVTFYPSSNNIGGFPSGGGSTATGLGAATITSTAQLIANVNEANTAGTPLKATTYSCFGASSATAKIALPQVKEAFGSNNTGVTIQNTDVAASATINAVYTCGGVAYTHVAKTLLPGSSYTYYLESSSAGNWTGTALTTNKLCAVTVTSGGQKIVGIAQEAAYPSGNLDTKNYEGFNLAP